MKTTVLPGDLSLRRLVKWMKHYIAVASADQRIKEMAGTCCSSDRSLACVLDKAYNLLSYKPDPEIGNEQFHYLWSVDQMFKRRSGNCHTYAILMASMLLNCGYYPKLRFVSYTGDAWDHVFIVVDGVILDPTIGQPQDGSATLHNRKGPVYNKTAPYKEKKDFSLSRLVLVQGLKNNSYTTAAPVGRLRAKRLGMDAAAKPLKVGQSEQTAEQAFKDILRLQWLKNFKVFKDQSFINFTWNQEKDKVKNKGVEQVVSDVVEWHKSAARGYQDLSEENLKRAKEGVQQNVSDFVVKHLVKNFQQYGWRESIRRLKDVVVIPEVFSQIKESESGWNKNLVNAGKFVLAKYFWHEAGPEDNPTSGVVYPELHTRGDFGDNAKEVLANRINWYIDKWAENFDNINHEWYNRDNLNLRGIPDPFIANLIASEAQNVVDKSLEQLDGVIDLSGKQNGGSSWMWWIPVGAAAAYIGYKAL